MTGDSWTCALYFEALETFSLFEAVACYGAIIAGGLCYKETPTSVTKGLCMALKLPQNTGNEEEPKDNGAFGCRARREDNATAKICTIDKYIPPNNLISLTGGRKRHPTGNSYTETTLDSCAKTRKR